MKQKFYAVSLYMAKNTGTEIYSGHTQVNSKWAHTLNCVWGDNKEQAVGKVVMEKLATDELKGFMVVNIAVNEIGPEVQITVPTISYQDRVWAWMLECFGEEVSNDAGERSHRFLEEALELVQALGCCTEEEAHILVNYVFNRREGLPQQEVGGVMVTLAALCASYKMDSMNMDLCGEDELKRVWTKIDEIREKQANKPKGSALPQ